MNKRAIEILLLVEDNAADARLIREMFREQGSQRIDLIHMECMRDAEKYLAGNVVDIILLDLIHKDCKPCGGHAHPRLTSLWWCYRAWTTSRWP
jgi:CheY-like chemotaxis protein